MDSLRLRVQYLERHTFQGALEGFSGQTRQRMADRPVGRFGGKKETIQCIPESRRRNRNWRRRRPCPAVRCAGRADAAARRRAGPVDDRRVRTAESPDPANF